MGVSEAAAAMIARYGQSITYRRTTANSFNATTGRNTPTTSDTTVTASVRVYSPREVAGLVQQGDREVRIPAGSLSFVPKAEDSILIGSTVFTVKAVNTRNLGGTDALHIIQIRGG